MGEIGITAGQVFDKISNRQVGFQMVEKVFKNMTEEGGKFYKMQEVQAATLAGKISNLKDAYDIMLNSFGEATRGPLVATIDTLKTIMEHYQAVGRVLVDIFAVFGSYATVGAITKLVSVFKDMGTAMSAATGFFGKINAAMKSIGIAAGGAYVALAALVTLLGIQLYRHLDEVNRELDKLVSKNFSNFSKEASNLDKLVSSLKNATQGSQEYRDIISKLNSQYGDYLDNLVTEANSYEEIALAAEKAKNAIAKKNEVDAREEGLKEIDRIHGGDIGDYTTQMIKWITDPKSFSQNISSKAASKIIQDFKNNLMEGLEQGKSFQAIFEEALNNYAPGIEIRKNAPGMLIAKLGDELRKQAEEVELLDAKLAAMFGSFYYNSAEEEKIIGNIESKFEGLFAHVNRLELPLEKVNEEIHTLEISRLEQLIEAYEKLGRTDMVNKYKKELAELTKVQTGWRKVVEEVLNDKNLNFKESTRKLFATNDGEQFTEWLKKLRDEYSKLDQQIKDTSNEPSLKEEMERYVDEKKAAEEVTRRLGVDINKPAQQRTNARNAVSEEKQRIQNDIAEVKALKQQYEQLLDLGLSSEDAKGELEAFAPAQSQIIRTLDFAGAIERLAQEMDDLGEHEDANKIRMTARIDSIKDYVKVLERQQKFEKDLQDFVNEGIGLTGQGVAFDLGKIINKYQDTIITIENKTKEMSDAAAKNFEHGIITAEDYQKAIEQIVGSGNIQKMNALNTALESVRDQADKFIKEWAKNGKTLDLSNWSHKSVAELQYIRQQLELLEETPLPEDITQKLKDSGIGIDEFIKKLKELIKNYKDETDNAEGDKTFWEKLFKKLDEKQVKAKVREIKSIAQSLQKLGESLNDYAETTSNAKLQQVTSAMSDVIDIGTEVAEAFATGGPWAGAVAIVAVLGSKALEAAASMNDLKKAVMETGFDVLEESLANILTYTDSIFGDNFLGNLSDASNLLKETNKGLDGIYERLTNIMNKSYDGLAATRDQISDGTSDLGNYLIITRKASGLFKFNKRESLSDIAKQWNMDLYDQYDNLDAKFLQKILDTYKELGAEDEKWIKEAIAYTNAYSDAMSQLKDNIQNLFGDLAGTIADEMISAFEETGDAMYDLSDTFAEVGKSMTKSIISSLLITNVFDKYRDKLLDISRSYGDSDITETEMMQQIADVMSTMKDDISKQSDVVNTILQYADELGWLQDEQNNNMSDGIKGITEETADLLASYINAIRADVSYAKTQRETIIGQIQQIINGLPAAPNLQYYMTQIEANTANIAESSASILERIDSVLTTEGGSSAIRTYAY